MPLMIDAYRLLSETTDHPLHLGVTEAGPPPAGLLSQENAPFSLQYPPYTGGDVANENYCQVSPIPGNPSSPCATAKITPGAVQFYFPNGSCFDQNAQGATYVYSGEQYNWISIYSPPSNTCNNTMNGGASTQFIGTIYTPGNAHIPCAVRDLWPTGARLLVPSSAKLPTHFRLVVDGAGIKANCTLFMRSEDAVEVSFVYPPA